MQTESLKSISSKYRLSGGQWTIANERKLKWLALGIAPVLCKVHEAWWVHGVAVPPITNPLKTILSSVWTCPPPPPHNPLGLQTDINNFVRTLRLRSKFGCNSRQPMLFRPKSNYVSPFSSHARLEDYIHALKMEATKLQPLKGVSPNLSTHQIGALETIRE